MLSAKLIVASEVALMSATEQYCPALTLNIGFTFILF
jgi:hypothetical protein